MIVAERGLVVDEFDVGVGVIEESHAAIRLTASISTRAATSASSTVIDSAGLWLMPPLQRTKSMADGAEIGHGHRIVPGAGGKMQRRDAEAPHGILEMSDQGLVHGRRGRFHERLDGEGHAAPLRGRLAFGHDVLAPWRGAPHRPASGHRG